MSLLNDRSVFGLLLSVALLVGKAVEHSWLASGPDLLRLALVSLYMYPELSYFG